MKIMSDNIDRRGLMLILSSPSGAGKTTVAKKLLAEDPHVTTSVSYTTRNKRDGEEEGKDYYFISEAQFRKMIENGEFLEYAEVFGNLYGTPRATVEENLRNGRDVIFDIDWQGSRQLTDHAREDVVSIFLLPPSKQILYNRLKSRNLDTEEIINFRMDRANGEIEHWDDYDYTIINRDLTETMHKTMSILKAERLKKARRLGVTSFVANLLAEEIEI